MYHRIYSPYVPPSNNAGPTIQITRAWGRQATPIPFDGIQVDSEVQTIQDPSLTPERSRHSLDRNMDRQLHDKPHELV